jgi:hypothetical protein
MSVTYRPGAFYCDVAPFDGRFLFVYEQGLAVVCEFDLSEVWRTAIPEHLLFLRCAVVNGLLHAIGQAHDSGNALLVNARGVVNLGRRSACSRWRSMGRTPTSCALRRRTTGSIC